MQQSKYTICSYSLDDLSQRDITTVQWIRHYHLRIVVKFAISSECCHPYQNIVAANYLTFRGNHCHGNRSFCTQASERETVKYAASLLITLCKVHYGSMNFAYSKCSHWVAVNYYRFLKNIIFTVLYHLIKTMKKHGIIIQICIPNLDSYELIPIYCFFDRLMSSCFSCPTSYLQLHCYTFLPQHIAPKILATRGILNFS